MHKADYHGNHLIPALFTDTGRGLMTLKPLKVDDVIISIPKRLLITTQTTLDSEIGDYIKSCTPKLTPLQVLCIFLMYEKAKGLNSSWHPYISVLPQVYTTPAYFSNEELTSLPRFLSIQAQQQVLTVKGAYEAVADILVTMETMFAFCHGVMGFEEFRWAWFVINTRSVYMKQDVSEFLQPEVNTYALAPLLDLLNHSPTVEVSAAYNKSSQCYEIKAKTPYKKYDQVFICYGPHDNTKLLLEYGFTVPHNPHNVVMFEIDEIIKYLTCQLSSQHSHGALMEKKLQILHSNQMTSDLSCSLDGLSWKLQTVLRILCMDFNELNSWKRILTGGECSKQTELKSKQLANECIQGALISNQETVQKVRLLPTSQHVDLVLSVCEERKLILESQL
ncbi:SET domain-containing protein 4-like isoform X2 [Amphiura filiformis]